MDTKVQVNSEIGKLNAVILHKPGIEIERMTPENIKHALYSDILNKRIVDKEYANFCGVFEKCTKVFYIEELLAQLLKNETTKINLVKQSCILDNCDFLTNELISHTPEQLASELITGFEYRKGIDPETYEKERYILKPLYNLFFTRDASSSIYNQVLIHPMTYQVRKRESLIFESIFTQIFGAETLHPKDFDPLATTEGGDTLIARPDTLCIGTGSRTSKKGIEFFINKFKNERQKFNLLIQELPKEPESFIHLDMVFTFLDTHFCMMYEPLISGKMSGFHTYHISIDNGEVEYHEKPSFLHGLKDLGFDLKPIKCGGDDPWTQQREQWHSGANFFALGEGKIIGYQRNWETIEALEKEGFAVLPAQDIVSKKIQPSDYKRFVATIEASELPRGCGGARCMTMPVNRDEVIW